MNSVVKKRVLVCPLDWGLGHATRCIPIINELLAQNADVIIGADGRPLQLLQKEFPELEVIKFPGVVIRYPDNGNFGFAIISQLPAIVKGFLDEHKFLKRIISEKRIDIVISDSRHGLFTKKIPSIFVIHQIRILLPKYLRWFELFVSWLNRKFMEKYFECWIPDFDDNNNCSGTLSHSVKLPANTHFIGTLSRFSRLEGRIKEIDVLIILSGPEPQRTILESICVQQLRYTDYHSVIVQGMTEESVVIDLDNITLVSSLPSEQLQEMIHRAKILIARSGYSTIMDFAALGVNAIFVPTPGQTEQEYLAEYFMQKKICYYETQENFIIARAIKESQKYSGFINAPSNSELLRKRIFHMLNL